MINGLDINPQLEKLIKGYTYKRFIIDFFVIYLQYKSLYYRYYGNKNDILNELNLDKYDLERIERLDERMKKLVTNFNDLCEYLNKKSKNNDGGINMYNFFSNKIETENGLWNSDESQIKTIKNFINDLSELDFSFVLSVIDLKNELESLSFKIEYFLKKDIKGLKNYGLLINIDLDFQGDGDVEIIIYNELIDIDFSIENGYENPNNMTSYGIYYNIYKLLKEQDESFFNEDLFKFLEG